MYHPRVQRSILLLLARWRRLPESDVLRLLSPTDRLQYRPEALNDLVGDGLVATSTVGDERVMAITEAGERWISANGPRGQSQGQGGGRR